MATDQTLSEEVQRLLAQFPGPVKIQYRRPRGFLFGFICLIAGIAFFIWTVSGGRNVFDSVTFMGIPWVWLGYAGILCAAIVLIVVAQMPLAGGVNLVLDGKGFRRSHAWLDHQKWLIWNVFDLIPWDEVSNFKSIVPRQVEFTRKQKEGGSRWENYCRQALTKLPEFGLLSDDLANLMNAWRERALSEQKGSAAAYGSSTVSQ